jgi:hypothetical protein
MSSSDDVTGDMRNFPHDDQTADALLDGRVVPDDAPPGYQGVAALIRTAKGPASVEECAKEATVVAAMTDALRVTAPKFTDGPRRRQVLGKFISAKVLAGATALVVGGGGAAGGTSSLPAPPPTPLSHGLSSVGVSIPNPNNHASGTSARPITPPATSSSGRPSPTTTTTTTTSSLGPSIIPTNVVALCISYSASNPNGVTDNSQAFTQLTAAAQAKDETVAQLCASVTPSSTSPSTTTTTTPTTTTTTTTPTTTPTTTTPTTTTPTTTTTTTTPTTTTTTTTTTSSSGPSITPSDVVDLCAYATDNSQAFWQLTAVAQAIDETVTQLCASYASQAS